MIKRSVVEKMNWMLNKVVTDGTGTAAKLDFTNVAGKTGTSTGPKDVWFVGFTGKYVAGVWLGNDDNRPMASGITGGHSAAPVWHDLHDGRAYRHEHSDHPRPRAAPAFRSPSSSASPRCGPRAPRPRRRATRRRPRRA